MKSILFPTDFSDNAWNAIDYGVSMFGSEDPKFTLVNAYDLDALPNNPIAAGSGQENAFQRESLTGLEATEEKMKNSFNLTGVALDHVSDYGHTSNVIADVAEDKNADLIIMGTQGASGLPDEFLGSHSVGLKEFFIGGNTASVIKDSHTSIIAVPANASFKEPKKILFAIDPNDELILPMLDPLKDLAKRYGSQIYILNVVPTDEAMVTGSNDNVLMEYFADIPHTFHINQYDKPDEGIHAFTEKHGIDVVAIVKRDHSFFKRLFGRNVTKHVALNTMVPLMVLAA